MCVVVKVELNLSQKCMHRTGLKQLATVVSVCYSLSFCCNRNRTETERGTGTETEQKVRYSCCTANIYFCSCWNHVIFCCNRNQINRKKQTVIWFERVTVVHYHFPLRWRVVKCVGKMAKTPTCHLHVAYILQQEKRAPTCRLHFAYMSPTQRLHVTHITPT